MNGNCGTRFIAFLFGHATSLIAFPCDANETEIVFKIFIADKDMELTSENGQFHWKSSDLVHLTTDRIASVRIIHSSTNMLLWYLIPFSKLGTEYFLIDYFAVFYVIGTQPETYVNLYRCNETALSNGKHAVNADDDGILRIYINASEYISVTFKDANKRSIRAISNKPIAIQIAVGIFAIQMLPVAFSRYNYTIPVIPFSDTGTDGYDLLIVPVRNSTTVNILSTMTTTQYFKFHGPWSSYNVNKSSGIVHIHANNYIVVIVAFRVYSKIFIVSDNQQATSYFLDVKFGSHVLSLISRSATTKTLQLDGTLINRSKIIQPNSQVMFESLVIRHIFSTSSDIMMLTNENKFGGIIMSEVLDKLGNNMMALCLVCDLYRHEKECYLETRPSENCTGDICCPLPDIDTGNNEKDSNNERLVIGMSVVSIGLLTIVSLAANKYLKHRKSRRIRTVSLMQ